MLALAIALTALRGRPLVKTAVFTLLASYSLGVSLPDYYKPFKLQYREAAAFIADRYRPGDIVLNTSHKNRIFYLHYLRRMIGPQIEASLHSISHAEQAAKVCDSLPNTTNRVHLYYHYKSSNLTDTVLKACAADFRVAEEKYFRGIYVKLLQRTNNVRPNPAPLGSNLSKGNYSLPTTLAHCAAACQRQ